MSQDMPYLKRCSKCGQTKSTDEFYNDSRRRDGKYSKCKDCHCNVTSHYYNNNIEKSKHIRAVYRKEHLSSFAESTRRYYTKNREVVLKRQRIYRQTHPEKERAKRHKYLHSLRGRWVKLKVNQKRRTRQRNLPYRFTIYNWEICLEYWDYSCAYCGSKIKIHADHYIPLAKEDCPGTIPKNIIPACRRCNCSKKNTIPIEWIRRTFPDRADAIIQAIEDYFKSLM